MYRALFCGALAAFALLAAGCNSYTSPYDYAENWLIREDPVRIFVIPSDVIYVQDELYVNINRVEEMQDHARVEVGYKRFGNLARAFSPLIATREDVDNAMKWYFKYHHEKGRPFTFIGEGKGGSLLHAYEKDNEEDLKEKGLVASFYTENGTGKFVSDEMIQQIKEAVARARYRKVWGREMPDGMLEE